MSDIATIPVAANNNGGYYVRGRSYGIEKKAEVAAHLQKRKLNVAPGDSSWSLRKIARHCKVTVRYVTKVEKELISNKGIKEPRDKVINRKRGAGANKIGNMDAFVIYQLYLKQPGRSQQSYVDDLKCITGTQVSRSTVSRFFSHTFPVKQLKSRKPSLESYDKFKPEDASKAKDYFDVVKMIDPTRLKFGNEKLLKSADIYKKRTRNNPGGQAPSDTHSIAGFLGINPNQEECIRWTIRKASNNSVVFSDAVENAIESGFLMEGDILVLDDAVVHNGGENNLAEKLWNQYRIFLLYLPTNTSAQSPMECLWTFLLQRLQQVPLEAFRHGGDAAAIYVGRILSGITLAEVQNLFQTCKYLDLQ